MSRHQRLRRTMRNPARQARRYHNRNSRVLRRALIGYFRHLRGGAR